MPQKTNLNVFPYYEDFDADKNFYKILFRPGYSIQGRELTQLQSILQNQVESFGKYVFKQGDLVIPGEVGLNTKLDFVKLSSVSEVAVSDGEDIVYKKYDITQLINRQVRGLSSGVTATILDTKLATEASADTLYVNYLNSGDSNTETTFRQGETLEVIDGVNTPLLVVGTDGSVLPTSILVTNPDTGETTSLVSPAMGYASAVKVEEGIYFVNGFFVRNETSLLVIDDYYDRPSAKVGFTIKEDIVTPEEDASLYDNSIGSSNYTAPGAHRLKITLELKRFDLNQSTDRNFIQLITVFKGSIQKKVSPTDYNLLEQTLARRTFDESGDYIVEDFAIDVREYAQRDRNRGLYALDEFGTYNGLSAAEAARKMVVSVGPGKAYIRGYEIVNKETKYLEISKARESLKSENKTLKIRGLPTFTVTNTYGTVPLNKEGAELTAFPNINLYQTFNDGSIGLSDTEADTDLKQTLDRRGLFFTSNDALKTVTLDVFSSTNPISSLSASNWESTFGELFFVKQRDTDGGAVSTSSFKVLSYAKVSKPLLSADPNTKYLEVVLFGPKDDIERMVDYDLGEPNSIGTANSGRRRRFYLTDGDARAQVEGFGEIIDYKDTITPLIGRVKPNNYFLKKRGSGFNSDADIVLSRGRSQAGEDRYNAMFGLSYFDPQFFTRIKLEEYNAQTGAFEIGKYVYGLTSGAYGVVEGAESGVYSFGTDLFIKTISGRFQSGETIRDEADNTARIKKDNTISHFVVQNKGNGYEDGSTIVVNGVEFDQAKLEVAFEGTSGIVRINIRNRNALNNTVYTQPPAVTIKQAEGGQVPTVAAAIIPVLTRNAVTTYTPANVKSVGASYGSGGSNVFTADIVTDDTAEAEITSVTDFTFFGSANTDFIESTSFSADASVLLQQGDLIQFVDVDNNLVRAVVQYATEPSGVFKSRIYLDTNLPGDVVNTNIIRLRGKVENSSRGSLIFPTGSKQVSKIVDTQENSNIKFYIRRDFITTASTGGGIITFAAQLPFGTQRFVTFTEQNTIITVLDPGDSPLLQKGDVVYVDPDNVVTTSATDTASGLTAGSIELQLPSTYFGTIPENGTYPKLKLTATLEVEDAKPRLKTSISKRIIIDSSGDRVIPFRGTDYDNDVVEVLSYSDAYKLKYVYEGSSAAPPTVDRNGNLVSGTDVTDRFTFDNGQRDTIYDVSRLVLKPGQTQTTGQLVVAFDYFEHSAGDFCVIDSYLHESGVSEDEIPSFNSTVHGVVNLKNVLDFRPKVDSKAIISGFQDTSILSDNRGSFSSDGAIVASSPAPDSNLEYTFQFSQVEYLDRIDGVFLNKKGQFLVKEGNSSLNPTKPDPVDDAIPLFYAYIPAYTQTSKDVRITPVDNRRYTMRDIGKLEKRIERLEYYTTLSILEQQALNMQVKDNVGLDRFKSGFIVDNFEAHRTGNLQSLDYQCAVDVQQSTLRPQSKEDSLRLIEVNEREDQRVVSGYRRNGDIITLPFEDLKVIGNDFASKTLNPNPFVVLQYVGDAQISPSIDQWYDQNEEPLVVDTNTDLYKIFLAKTDTKESFSSFYNSFITNWVGSSLSFSSINSLGETNSEAVQSTVSAASVSSSSNVSPQNNEVGKGVQKKIVRGNTVSTSLQFFARSQPIKFIVRRLKPNTTLSVFLEGRNVNRWVVPDQRFSGIAGNSLSAFNGTVTTDENGDASGIILLPAGYAPSKNAVWTGDIDTVDYDTSSEEFNVSTGIKTFRFTSSATDEDKAEVATYAEVKYYATGILPENPVSIISTKPSFFKANEGVQFIDSNTDNPIRPNPLAQTFKVENYEGGMFATGIDLFFSKKSSTIPIKVYLTNVDSDKPGKNIIPGSEKVLSPFTFLKFFTNSNVYVTKGEVVTGASSAATGPIAKIIDKNGIELTPSSTGRYLLTNEQVYTMVLDNHNGRAFLPNENLSIPSVTLANNTEGRSGQVTIAKDSGRVSSIKIKNPGLNYDSAILTIESPQLPGGSVATASVDVSGGQIYNSEIQLSGFGYTEAPSVVIKGIGNGAAGAVIETAIEIDTPAVRMGVAIDQEGITNSTVPTRFAFEHPVYLQNDTEYAIAVETDSVDYEMWASRLGEIDASTSTIITTQPSLGSVYRSQNIDNWTEDIFEDLKFTLYRAEFDISRPCELLLTNENLGYELLNNNPFETDGSSNSNADSLLFKNNNNILKVNHRDNGFEDTGKSYVFYKSAAETGGITTDVLNNTLFRVSNSGVDSYNITSSIPAALNSVGGGSTVYASYNRKFEVLYPQVQYLTFSQTKIDTSVQTLDVVPVDSATTNYTSYSQKAFEQTFLNEPHYFTNQKFIASKINEIQNDVERSLTYKMDLSSSVSYLSPVIDLSTTSVKTVTNRVENASGKEDRFGRRNQILTFFPVYSFTVANTNGIEITNDQKVKGLTSGALGQVCKVSETEIYVKVKTVQLFQKGEVIEWEQEVLNREDTEQSPATKVDTVPNQFIFDFNTSQVLTARNPSTPTNEYENIIFGNVIIWNSETQEITMRNDTRPIDNDYTSRIVDGQAFTRQADTLDQAKDVFRVGDIVGYPNQPTDEVLFLEVGSLDYTNGTDYVEENTSKNTSAIAKYVTKEVFISSPATSIDVHLTLNVKEMTDVEVLFKYKRASSQENFEDLDWEYFNGNGQPDVLEVATPENTSSGVIEKQSSYQDITYSVEDLPEFSSFGIKIIMKGVDPTIVPKVQDIRAVASF